MTEHGLEKVLKRHIESSANWAQQYGLVIGGVVFIILLIAGFVLLKKEKKNAGYICLGIGLLVLISDIVKALL